jgi:uncharacterized protein YbjT (DUF2867 family)
MSRAECCAKPSRAASQRTVEEDALILITGATGNVGTELLKRLSRRSEKVRVFVRRGCGRGAIPARGVEFVEGDFNQPASFVPALTGVERLFLLIPSSEHVEQQQKELVDAAKHSGVRQIVKLSQLGAHENSRARFQKYHGAVENYIVKSGIAYTFLRPNLFMQALLNFRSAIASQGVLYAPAGNGRVSIVDVRDIAAVAERALTEPGHEGKVYDITGPQALTHGEMAATLSRSLGRTIKHVDIARVAFREALASFGVPQWQVEGVVEDYEQYRNGEASVVTSTVRDVTGQEAHAFGQFAEDYAMKFLGQAANA